MAKIITTWATIKVVMEIPDGMEEEQAVDEFFNNTHYNFGETENVGIVDTEFVDLTTESPFEEDEEDEDLDDEFYRKGYIEDNDLESYIEAD